MTILDKIVANTQAQVAERKKEISANALRDLAEQKSAERKATGDFRDFEKALRADDGVPHIISELKKASPSKGLIREDFRPTDFGPALASHGASALSILTETDFFQGSPEYLKAVRPLVNIPVLRKDFLVEDYQIWEAVEWGADALLLIASCLEASQYRDLYQHARELGIAVLSEVHDMHELEMVMKEGAHVVGVNARNLKTFAVDLDLTKQMISEIPKEVVRVAESGIKDGKDIRNLFLGGADAFLIGETLMRHEKPEEKLVEMLREAGQA